MSNKMQRLTSSQFSAPVTALPPSSSLSNRNTPIAQHSHENITLSSPNGPHHLQFQNSSKTNILPFPQNFLLKPSNSNNFNNNNNNFLNSYANINNSFPNNSVNSHQLNTNTLTNNNQNMNSNTLQSNAHSPLFKPQPTKKSSNSNLVNVNSPNFSHLLSPSSSQLNQQQPPIVLPAMSPLSSPINSELPGTLNSNLNLTPNKVSKINPDHFYMGPNPSKGLSLAKSVTQQNKQISKSSRSPLRLAAGAGGLQSLSQSFQTPILQPLQASPSNPSYQQQINQLSQILNKQTFNYQQQQQQQFDQQQQYLQQPEELRFVKKTQQMIKEVGSESSTANDMEHIEDLDESVEAMMNELSLYQQAQKGIIPNADPTKFSLKGNNGVVSCYAAKTHQGIVRNYNEDRVSIILNIMKPPNRLQEENWPKCSFFGVYDGHGGVSCADFLRDHLHQFVIRDQNFPWNPEEAIKNGFELAESYFLKQAQQQMNRGNLSQVDRSGSCAVVVLIVDDTCYVANVGDSRAVISMNGGKVIEALTRDHKPMDRIENARIHQNGGRVYQTKIESIPNTEHEHQEDVQVMLGPYRVLPGRLSVTRTFGDIEAKFVRYGGNPRVVVAVPEIKSFKIDHKHDFIVLGCDGIFDKINSHEVGQIIWDTSENEPIGNSVHEFCGKSIENVLKLAISRKTQDNITAVIIGFDQLEVQLFKGSGSSTRHNQNISNNSNNNHLQKSSSTSSPQNQLSNFNLFNKETKTTPNVPLSPLQKPTKQKSYPSAISPQISSNNHQTPSSQTSNYKQIQQHNSTFQLPGSQSSKRTMHGSIASVINPSSPTEKDSNSFTQKPRTCLPLGNPARNLLQNHVLNKPDPLLSQSLELKKQSSRIIIPSKKQTALKEKAKEPSSFSSGAASDLLVQTFNDAKFKQSLLKTLLTK